MTGKSGAGEGAERFYKVQIVVGGCDADVTHVGRQKRQFRLHFNARSIPSKHRVNGKAVTKIMNPWQPTVRLLDVCHLEKQSYISP